MNKSFPTFPTLLFLLISYFPLYTSGQIQNEATPVKNISVKEGFQVELIYTVPKEKLGSWVNLCLDNKGRIIASDQYGSLYRFPIPKSGEKLKDESIEKIPVDIRAANGLLWAFDGLYVAVNDYERKIDSGLYKLTDTDGDDMLDKVQRGSSTSPYARWSRT